MATASQKQFNTENTEGTEEDFNAVVAGPARRGARWPRRSLAREARSECKPDGRAPSGPAKNSLSP